MLFIENRRVDGKILVIFLLQDSKEETKNFWFIWSTAETSLQKAFVKTRLTTDKKCVTSLAAGIQQLFGEKTGLSWHGRGDLDGGLLHFLLQAAFESLPTLSFHIRLKFIRKGRTKKLRTHGLVEFLISYWHINIKNQNKHKKSK